MAKVSGLEEVMRKLNKEVNGIKERTVAGLFEVGLGIEGGAAKRVPREHGDLFASKYTQKSPADPKVIEVGFSAAHALYVHENLEMKLKGEKRKSGIGVYWGPKGENQFLSKAVKEAVPTAAEKIAKHAKVGGSK